MSLEYLLDQGWIERVDPEPEEIDNLIDIIQRNIEKASLKQLGLDWTFNILYAAIINISSCALRARGFRAKSNIGHYQLLQTLEETMDADSELLELLDSYRKKRNLATYEIGGHITQGEVDEIKLVSAGLYNDLRERIRHLQTEQ
jgi:hypothetical protein